MYQAASCVLCIVLARVPDLHVLLDQGLQTETLQKERELLSQSKIAERIVHARKFGNIMHHSTVFSSKE